MCLLSRSSLGNTEGADGYSDRAGHDVTRPAFMATTLRVPNQVNDNAARVVAAGVATLALTTLVTGWLWVIPLITVGFAARVLSGPRFSLLGRLATQVIAPRLGPAHLVPGPPKRFAQAIGLFLTTVASVAAYGFGAELLALALVAVLLAFASLESIFGVCRLLVVRAADEGRGHSRRRLRRVHQRPAPLRRTGLRTQGTWVTLTSQPPLRHRTEDGISGSLAVLHGQIARCGNHSRFGKGPAAEVCRDLPRSSPPGPSPDELRPLGGSGQEIAAGASR